MAGEDDARRARQGRIAALIVAGSGLAALVALFLPYRLSMLLLLSAMAGFIYALVVAIGLWRRRE